MFAWEASASKRVTEPRNEELRGVLKFVYAATGIMSMIWIASTLMGLAAFTTYYLSGHTLSADIIFPALYLFEMLTFPLLDVPVSLATFAESNTSLRRIAVRTLCLACHRATDWRRMTVHVYGSDTRLRAGWLLVVADVLSAARGPRHTHGPQA
jgi:hypothetical protein